MKWIIFSIATCMFAEQGLGFNNANIDDPTKSEYCDILQMKKDSLRFLDTACEADVRSIKQRWDLLADETRENCLDYQANRPTAAKVDKILTEEESKHKPVSDNNQATLGVIAAKNDRLHKELNAPNNERLKRFMELNAKIAEAGNSLPDCIRQGINSQDLTTRTTTRTQVEMNKIWYSTLLKNLTGMQKLLTEDSNYLHGKLRELQAAHAKLKAAAGAKPAGGVK